MIRTSDPERSASLAKALPSRAEPDWQRTIETERLVTSAASFLADVATGSSVSAVVTRIANGFVRTLGARAAWVHLCSADTQLHLVVAENLDSATFAQLRTLDSRSNLPAAVAVRSGTLQIAPSAGSLRAGRDPQAKALAGEVVVALPLLAGTAVAGVVSASFASLARRPRAALSPLAGALGVLLDRAHLRGEVGQLEETLHKYEERTALIAHDLRHAAHAAVLNASYLSRRSDAEEQRVLERVCAAGHLLDRMVSDLSDASLLETGRFSLRLDPTRVGELVTRVVERHGGQAIVSLGAELPPLSIDPQRIDQVLTNLLENAVTHGRPRSRAQVEVERRGDAVVISVTNDGVGISDQDQSKLFAPYNRGRERGAEARGLGLGLYICRRLIEEHGGRIWVVSDSSRTRFSFSLPISPSR